MTFKFKMDSVLKVRTHKMKLEQQKLAALLAEEAALQQQYELQYNRYLELISGSGGSSLTEQPRERFFQNFLLIETTNLNEVKKKISQKKTAIEKQRSRVTSADRDLKMIEKLKKRALVDFRKETEKLEQDFQNEVATQMYYRQRNNGYE